MKPHSHAQVIKAWADGAEIEYSHAHGDVWRPLTKCPHWYEDILYRVKPQPKIEVRYMHVDNIERLFKTNSYETVGVSELWQSNINMGKHFAITFTDGEITSVQLMPNNR